MRKLMINRGIPKPWCHCAALLIPWAFKSKIPKVKRKQRKALAVKPFVIGLEREKMEFCIGGPYRNPTESTLPTDNQWA